MNMKERVTVYDGDDGEVYTLVGNPWEFMTCDNNDTVLYAEAFIVAAQQGWEILGQDKLGDIQVRTQDRYDGHDHDAIRSAIRIAQMEVEKPSVIIG